MFLRYFVSGLLVLVFSWISYLVVKDPEVPFIIKITNIAWKMSSYYHGLGTDNFNRNRYNNFKYFLSLFRTHSELTHIESFKVPSLIDSYQIEVKIYMNKTFMQSDKKLPSLIYIHGGGWVIDYWNHTFYESFTSQGLAFIEIHYRLAPENKFPVPLEDCYSAIHSKEILKYSDTNRLSIMGDSAGANLVTAVLLLMKERKSPLFPIIRSKTILYPATFPKKVLPSHLKYQDWYFLTKSLMEYYRLAYAKGNEDLENEFFNPMISKNLNDFPDMLVILSTRDYLFSEGEEFVEVMKNAGNNVKVRVYEAEHGFMLLESDESYSALNDVVEFLKEKKQI